MKSINGNKKSASSVNSLQHITYTLTFLTILLLSGTSLFAQIKKPVSKSDTLNAGINVDTTNTASPSDESEIFIRVDEFPEYPGGREAMQAYLTQKIVYPRDVVVEGVIGTVVVTFIVNINGSISKIKIIKGLHKSLDKIAVDAIKGMPAWKPGKVKGKEVRTQVNLPIKFLLPEE